MAVTDPAHYLAELSRSTEGAELTAEAGLGDLTWIVSADASMPQGLWG